MKYLIIGRFSDSNLIKALIGWESKKEEGIKKIIECVSNQ